MLGDEDLGDAAYPVSQVRTPALLVDVERMKRNIARMNERAAAEGLRVRPHFKTHKTLAGARLQLADLPADSGVIVSTLVEAKLLADDGFQDLLYAVPVDPTKAGEVLELSKRVQRFHVLLDNPVVADALEAAAKEAGQCIRVFLKIDTGYGRAGIKPADEPTLRLALRLAHTPDAFIFSGIYSHAGHSYGEHCADELQRIADEDSRRIAEFSRVLSSQGVHVPVVSVGATPTCAGAKYSSGAGVTEIHPGNYVFYDRQQVAAGACSADDVAVTVLTRVLSHYPLRKPQQILLDTGALSLSKDTAPQGGFGTLLTHPDIVLTRISQEEAVAQRVDGGDIPFDEVPIGSAVRVLPNHACLAAAPPDVYHVVSGDQVVAHWRPVRGW